MRLTGVNHIGVAVKDIEKARAYLIEKFEARLLHETASKQLGIHFVLVDLGDVRLELMSPLREDGKLSELINRREGDSPSFIPGRKPSVNGIPS